ncbi:MAG: ABC transporter substrate-binding protein [Chloroflexota bacterium]
MSLDNEKWRISRRDFLRVTALATGGIALTACGAPSTPSSPTAATAAGSAPAAAGQKGGTLRAAIIGEPPSLDPHWTTANVSTEVTCHICETLFTLDEKLQSTPLLAESLETSKDGLTNTIKLRKGIRFHNGKEMTAEDVEASLLRWSKLSGQGKMLFQRLDSIGKPDPYTMVFKMNTPYAVFDSVLNFRSQAATVMPKEEAEAATEKKQITRPIGTGPYKFVEQQKDRFIRVARFESYHGGSGDMPDGAGGKRAVFLDEILFTPVPDQSVRVAGIQSGDYDYAEGINPDQFALLKDSKTVTTLVGIPTKCPTHYINKKSPIMADVKLRQAMMATIDPESALKAGWGSPDFYRVSGALMPKEGPWYTEVATDRFNLKSVDKAKQLLSESKYKGEPIRYLTTQEYPNMYQEAVVLNQSFQTLGLNTKLEVIDWASLISRRAKPEEWELFVTWNGYYTDPSLMDWMNPDYPGWWTNPEIDALRNKLLQTIDQKERFSIFEDVQRLFYEQIPILKLGDVRDLWLTSPKLKQVGTYPTPYFWNAYFAK